MSANIKVIFIVVIGVGACLLSIFSSRYFYEKDRTNQQLLSRIEQIAVRIEHVRLLGRIFIQDADQTTWEQILNTMESVRRSLQASPQATEDQRQEIGLLNKSLEEYFRILKQLYEPAINLKARKKALQEIGLTFSREVEEQIIKPYRKEESLRIYNGEPIDPFKARAKDAAYDLVALHIKQQVILLELLLSSDLEGYKQKKQLLSAAMEQHKAQLRYMAVLMGDDPAIQSVLDSLDKKLLSLLGHEQAVIEHFAALAGLEERLSAAGNKLLVDGREFSTRIAIDTIRISRLNRTLSWSLLLGILVILSVLGALLASNIILFVDNLKVTQMELKESEERLKLALDATNDGLWDLNPQSSQAYFSPRWYTMLEYEPDDFPATYASWANLLHTDDRSDAEARLKSFMQNPESTFSVEFRMRTKSGGWRWIHSRGKAVEQDSEGNISRMIGTHIDITERKRAEEELRWHREHLEELVQERTRELEAAHAELLKRERLSALGQLTATVSHELRNPLGAIRSSAFYVLRKLGDPDDKIVKHLVRIDKQVEICDAIVGDLLEYTRDRYSEKLPGDINAWLQQLVDEFEGFEGGKIVYEPAPDVPPLPFDRERMRRVLVNLVTNAVQAVTAKSDYAKSKGIVYRPHVSISTRRKENQVIILVEDNGIGMDQQTLARAFEALYTTRAKGTGLGLAIVKKIVDEHGGMVSLESNPEKGTQARIVLQISDG